MFCIVLRYCNYLWRAAVRSQSSQGAGLPAAAGKALVAQHACPTVVFIGSGPRIRKRRLEQDASRRRRAALALLIAVEKSLDRVVRHAEDVVRHDRRGIVLPDLDGP